jgi:hypothetical protein
MIEILSIPGVLLLCAIQVIYRAAVFLVRTLR